MPSTYGRYAHAKFLTDLVNDSSMFPSCPDYNEISSSDEK